VPYNTPPTSTKPAAGYSPSLCPLNEYSTVSVAALAAETFRTLAQVSVQAKTDAQEIVEFITDSPEDRP
jgi:hypothetical protein